MVDEKFFKSPEKESIVDKGALEKVNVKSLLPETKNFMYTVLNKNNIVSTNTLGGGAAETLNPIALKHPNSPSTIPITLKSFGFKLFIKLIELFVRPCNIIDFVDPPEPSLV